MDDSAQPLTTDPVYYVTVAFFALLTTALPALLGQPRFLPVVQALALTLFVAIPARAGLWKRSVAVAGLWLAIQLVVVAGIARVAPQLVERSIPGGFELETGLLAWVYGAAPSPATPLAEPMATLMELGGLLLGSLLTAGLAGYWFLMRATNETGFSLGIVLNALEGPLALPLSIPVWGLLQIAGMAGFVILLSEPLLRGQWSPAFYWQNRKRLLIASALLLVSGYLLSVAGPPLWQSMFAVIVPVPSS